MSSRKNGSSSATVFVMGFALAALLWTLFLLPPLHQARADLQQETEALRLSYAATTELIASTNQLVSVSESIAAQALSTCPKPTVIALLRQKGMPASESVR